MHSGRLRARTDEVSMLNGNSNKNADFVYYDLVSDVMVLVLGEYSVM